MRFFVKGLAVLVCAIVVVTLLFLPPDPQDAGGVTVIDTTWVVEYGRQCPKSIRGRSSKWRAYTSEEPTVVDGVYQLPERWYTVSEGIEGISTNSYLVQSPRATVNCIMGISHLPQRWEVVRQTGGTHEGELRVLAVTDG